MPVLFCTQKQRGQSSWVYPRRTPLIRGIKMQLILRGKILWRPEGKYLSTIWWEFSTLLPTWEWALKRQNSRWKSPQSTLRLNLSPLWEQVNYSQISYGWICWKHSFSFPIFCFGKKIFNLKRAVFHVKYTTARFLKKFHVFELEFFHRQIIKTLL